MMKYTLAEPFLDEVADVIRRLEDMSADNNAESDKIKAVQNIWGGGWYSSGRADILTVGLHLERYARAQAPAGVSVAASIRDLKEHIQCLFEMRFQTGTSVQDTSNNVSVVLRALLRLFGRDLDEETPIWIRTHDRGSEWVSVREYENQRQRFDARAPTLDLDMLTDPPATRGGVPQLPTTHRRMMAEIALEGNVPNIFELRTMRYLGWDHDATPSSQTTGRYMAQAMGEPTISTFFNRTTVRRNKVNGTPAHIAASFSPSQGTFFIALRDL